MGKVPASISNVQTCSLSKDTIAFAFGAPTTSRGELLNLKKADKAHHTAREYSSHPVRFWDKWVPPERNSLYYTVIKKADTPKGKKWNLSNRFTNALKGTKLQFPFFPSGFMNEGGDYALSVTGILLQTLDPGLNLAWRWLYGVYHIPLTTFEEDEPPKPKRIETPDYTGSQSKPVFTLDGKVAALTVNKSRHNDISSPVAIAILHLNESKVTLLVTEDPETQKRTWDRRPGSLLFSNDSKVLYIEAADRGHNRLFKLPLDVKEGPSIQMLPIPERLSHDGSVASVSTMNRLSKDTGRLFVSMTGILESSLYALVNPASHTIKAISSATNQGKLLGFNAQQLTEITFKGAGDYDVQAFVVRPSSFDPSKKYPLALLIHGGPQAVWPDAWSTRWNYCAFAEQDYIVIAPNITGSTGFGDAFMAAVDGDWGGRPYEDLVAAVEYAEKNIDYIDTTNTVALGGSYGGYMANWIAGQPLAKKIKAIVSHDGIFTHQSQMASDLIAYYDQDVGGTLWDKPEIFNKWSPSSYTGNWNTPMLIIHSDGDFRCPITEGLAAYGVLQAKGIESRFLNFPDENHFVLGRENSLKWYHTVLGWINKFTGAKGGVVLEDACCDPKFED